MAYDWTNLIKVARTLRLLLPGKASQAVILSLSLVAAMVVEGLECWQLIT